MLECATSPQEAVNAAESLIGQWPHAKPPDPKRYSAALAATLASYPRAIVEECCDPRCGLALKREFPPTVAAVVEWCDRRLEFHKAVAGYKGKSLERPAYLPSGPPVEPGLVATMLSKLVEYIRMDPTPAPLDRLHNERRDSLAMTRRSILERGAGSTP